MLSKKIIFSLALTAATVVSLPPLAANPNPDVELASSTVQGFRVSEKVEILRDNQWRRGEILAVQTAGQDSTYRVRYLDVGFEENGVVGSRLRKSTVKPVVRRFFEVGTPVGVQDGDSYKEGVITSRSVVGRGNRYKVSFDDLTEETDLQAQELLDATELAKLGMERRVYDLSTQAAIDEIVDVHNEWRAKVGVQPLTWSDELAAHSQDWADILAQEQAMYHRAVSANPYGENLASSRRRPMTPRLVVNLWGDEYKYYDYESNLCLGPMCGHYTQMVWHETTQVGCAMTKHEEKQFEIWVCSYDPPGNYSGERPY